MGGGLGRRDGTIGSWEMNDDVEFRPARARCGCQRANLLIRLACLTRLGFLRNCLFILEWVFLYREYSRNNVGKKFEAEQDPAHFILN